MRLEVKSVPQGVSQHSLKEGARELDLLSGLVRYEGEVEARFSVTRHQENLFIKGSVEAMMVGECSRCLEPFHKPVSPVLTVYAERSPDGGTEVWTASSRATSTCASTMGIASSWGRRSGRR